jgi:hypothetical protein
METLITITNFLILGLILASPIFILILLKRLDTKEILITYSLVSLLITGVLILIFAWWADKSDMILLEHYGYNWDGWNDAERFKNVTSEHKERVKEILISVMGIGWPVKAIFGFEMFIPYLIIVYIGKILINKLRIRKNGGPQ